MHIYIVKWQSVYLSDQMMTNFTSQVIAIFLNALDAEPA